MANSKTLSAAIEKQAAQDREREFARLKRELATAQTKLKSSYQTIDGLKQEVADFAEITNRKPTKPFKSVAKDQKHPATAIVIFSDWHVGETVRPEQVNGLNEYSPAIAKKRAEAVTQNALRLIEDARGMATVDTLVIGLLGDFITGWIHDELSQTNAMPPIEETLFVGELLEASLRSFEKNSGCSQIHIVCLVGNHGRHTKKTQAANRTATSHEYGMYCQLARSLKGTRLGWHSLSPHAGYVAMLDIGGGHVGRFMHGDSIKYQGGIGGMTIPVIKQIYRRNEKQKADFDFFGDKHTYWPGPNFQANGSLIGYGAYGNFLGFPYQDPLQTFALCDHRRGMVSVRKLFCN